MFTLESPHRGDSSGYTQYAIFQYEKEKHPKLSQICSYGIFFQGIQERVRKIRGKRAISVRAIEVLLYLAESCITNGSKEKVSTQAQKKKKKKKKTKLSRGFHFQVNGNNSQWPEIFHQFPIDR